MRHVSTLIDITAEMKIDGQRAWLINKGDSEVWVAKSLVEWDGETTFTMPEWLAKEKDLI